MGTLSGSRFMLLFFVETLGRPCAGSGAPTVHNGQTQQKDYGVVGGVMRRVMSAAAILVGFMFICAWATVPAGAARQQAAAGGGAAGAKAARNPVPPTPESIAAGKQVFSKNCVDCHGRAGKGDGENAPEGSKPSDFTDAKWDNGSTDEEILAVIRKGVGPKYDMDGFRDALSEKDIWNVINYIRSIGPAGTKRD